MNEDRIARRVRLGRQFHLDWDGPRVERLAAGLGARRRVLRRRRVVAGSAVAALVLIGALARDRAARAPDADSLAAHPPETSPRVRTGKRPPRFAPAAGERDLAGTPEAPGFLPDLARDRDRAEALLASFAAAPHTHPVLPDVRHAGYHHGQPGSARAASPLVDVKAAPFAAAGDGITDDTEAIRRALRAVERGGGVIYFPNGRYLVSSVLFVHGSGTVLRGESREGTQLVFTRPLDTAFGTNLEASGQSRWQWTGGLVWFTPKGGYTHPAAGERLRWHGDSPVAASGHTNVRTARVRGDRTLEVADTTGLRAGALVMVAVDASPELLAAGWRREHVRARGSQATLVRWPVEVATVEGKVVTLAQPLRFDLPLALHPRLERIADEKMIRECGLERMTLVMRRDPAWAKLGISEPFGWNGPFFQNAVHGFTREVTVVDGDQFLGTAASKHITFADVKAISTGLPEPRVAPRGFSLRSSSHDVLVEGVQIDPRYWFKIRIEGSGVVLSRVAGGLRYLAGRASDSVLTDVTVLVPHPRAPHPDALTGERIVGWGLHVGKPRAELGGARPNLYQAQRRLGADGPR